jgi:hypothetical protein
MSGTLLQILVTLVVVGLVITMFVRPSGIFPIVMAVGIVLVAIVVTWSQIDAFRAQKASDAAVARPEAQAGVTVPAPPPARSGS